MDVREIPDMSFVRSWGGTPFKVKGPVAAKARHCANAVLASRTKEIWNGDWGARTDRRRRDNFVLKIRGQSRVTMWRPGWDPTCILNTWGDRRLYSLRLQSCKWKSWVCLHIQLGKLAWAGTYWGLEGRSHKILGGGRCFRPPIFWIYEILVIVTKVAHSLPTVLFLRGSDNC